MSYPIDFPGIKFREAQPYITPGQAAQSRANMHIGNPGGVRMVGGNYLGGHALSGVRAPYEVIWYGLPQDGSFINLVNSGGGRIGAQVVGGFIRLILDNVPDGTPLAIPTELTYFSLRYDGALGYELKNLNTGAVAAGAHGYYPVATRGDGWIVAFTGVVKWSRIFNVGDITADERAAVMRGETPEVLARRGGSIAVSSFAVVVGGTALTAVTSSGWTQNKTATIQYITASPGFQVVAGRQYRFEGTQTQYGINYVYLDGAGNNQGNNGFAVGASGAFSGTFTAVSTGTSALTFQTVSNAVNYTVSAVVFSEIGTVADYRPENVLRSGKWPDASGNCFDLTPGAGITALDPIEAHTRTFAGTITASLPGLGAGGFNEVTPIVASADPAYAAVQLGDVTHVTFASVPPTGVYIRGGVNATANGQVTVALSSTDEDAQTLTTVPVTVTHISK